MSQGLESPARAGVGFKPVHFRDILVAPQPIGFFEVHAENYMGAGGPPHAQLAALRERYAVVAPRRRLVDRLDAAARSRLISRGSGSSCERYEPESFSEHLAWSSHDGVYFNDLLPLPYTPADAGARRRAYRRGADGARAADAAGKSIHLYAVRRKHDPGGRIPRRAIANGPDADCCSTSTTCSSRPVITVPILRLSGRVPVRTGEGNPSRRA